jgi:hypothetical protein
MANELQIFNHPVFGELEVLVKEGKEYFSANDSYQDTVKKKEL